MQIHHLNCATLRPFGGRRVNGDRPPWRSARLVCHCLLIESDRGLVLVDSGFGLGDIARMRHVWNAPRGLRRYAYTKFAINADLNPDEAAINRVTALGHDPADVTDVVLTHLDLDHAGGLADFPHARVHVHETEHAFATAPPNSSRPFRYWPYQWAHGPDWVTYGAGGGDEWFGFEGVREVEGLPGIALVPLSGHSAGQCGVAVRTGEGWLLHAADSYFDHREVDPVEPTSTPGLAGFQKRLEFDGEARRESRQRLRELAARHADDVDFFCSHDPVEFDRFASPTR